MADLPPDSDGDPGGRRTPGSTANTPRWVKVFVIITVVLVGAFVVIHLAGGGMGGHTP